MGDKRAATVNGMAKLSNGADGIAYEGSQGKTINKLAKASKAPEGLECTTQQGKTLIISTRHQGSCKQHDKANLFGEVQSVLEDLKDELHTDQTFRNALSVNLMRHKLNPSKYIWIYRIRVAFRYIANTHYPHALHCHIPSLILKRGVSLACT